MTSIVVDPRQSSLKQLLERSKSAMAEVLPKHITAERLTKIALSCTNRTPDLLDCTPLSILRSVMQASELGLEAGGLLGEGYLIPFKNKVVRRGEPDRWELQCQFMPGYRGLVKLARQSGKVASVEARVVYSNDVFEYEFGLSPKLVHKPTTDVDRGIVTHFYSIVRLKDGEALFDVMSKAEVDAVRAKSKTGQYGPWADHYNEMGKKTVLKRVLKLAPVSTELTVATQLSDTAGTSEQMAPSVDFSAIVTTGEPVNDDGQARQAPQERQSKLDAMKQAMREREPGDDDDLDVARGDS